MESVKTTADEVQIRRLTLFSSGVGFFEYSGDVDGNEEMSLPFNKNAVNDALKSLVINDPDASPTVSYLSEQTLASTMKGLSIDLHGNTHISALLNSLKGAEVEVFTPNPIRGRIMLVEFRGECRHDLAEIDTREAFLSLLTPEGIRIISLKEINWFSFTDPKINADANRALDLILQSRNSDVRNLTVKLPGQKARKVSLSYVIPTPVWKVSYRLDLSKKEPFLQGWAIVDNDSDTDWNQVELALVTGKPVSFIQDLYAPYHLHRPTLPLAIAGIAEAKTYESGIRPMAKTMKSARAVPALGYGGNLMQQSQVDSLMYCESIEEIEPELSVEDLLISTGAIETAQGRTAGDQFEFTIKSPVSLSRRQSAMLPLVEGAVHAEKTLVFSAAISNKSTNPSISVELVNNTGMRLPAGPITVYDGGTYAGDALIEFFPESEKRIISYGEDLTVSGYFSNSTNYTLSAVSVSSGTMVINQQRQYERIYTFKNVSNETKRLIVEHPFSSRLTKLVEPQEYTEKTSNLYRFELALPPGDLRFVVREEEPLLRKVALSGLSFPECLSYTSNQEFPEYVRAGLQHALELRQKIGAKKTMLESLQNQLQRLFAEQDRTRKNLEAVGAQTQQGQSYLSRLESQENDIDAIHAEINSTEQEIKATQQEFEAYIQGMHYGENFQ